ncbi:MAG: hypothetical protein C1943_17365 [Halochromatium sp.]|nr:hypothetical protein [Halochromatium sp.]
MDVASLEYSRAEGWSVSPFPALDSEQTLVLVFGGSFLVDEPSPIRELRAAFPKAKLIGCSTAGEIIGTSVKDGGLVVAVARFAATRLASAITPVVSSNQSREAAQRLAQQLSAPDLQAVLVLSDGLHVNGSQLVNGFNEVLQGAAVVTGGLAGDDDRFQRTWVLNGSEPVERHIVALGLYGHCVRVGHGSRGGWDIFGPERRVTRASGNVLYELDGRPALALYQDYLGELAAGLPATALRFPLALRAAAAEQKRLVRTVLAVSATDGSMTFAGDIPEGCLAQLMRANLDHLIDGAEEAASMACGQGGDADPTLAIAISCVGRRMVLGERAEEEVEVTLDQLSAATQQVGFYSYGEISPYASGSCDLHNQTMTLTTIHEA